MPHEQRYNDFWAFLGKGTCSCKHRRSLHCERWAVDSPCSQLRHWSESPSASLTMVRRAGCRGPCIYLSVDKYDAVSPNLPHADGSQGAEGPVSTCPWASDAVLPQPPTHLDLYFYGTHHLIPTRAPAPALAPPPGAFARRHTHTGARPPYVLAPAVLPRSTPALALAPHANRSVVGGRALSGPSCRPPGTGSLRPSPSTVPDPPFSSFWHFCKF